MNNKFQKDLNSYFANKNMELYAKSVKLHLLYSKGLIKFSSAMFTLEMHLENIIEDMVDLIVRGAKVRRSNDVVELALYNKELSDAISLLDLEISEYKK